jgi:hypothetical protein
MQRIFSSRFWKNGSSLVLLIALLGIISAALTVWMYTQHVYSSHEAEIISSKGIIAALYPQRLEKKIVSHQIAKVTFSGVVFSFPCKAEVVSVTQTMLGRRSLLLVKLELIDLPDHKNPLNEEKIEQWIPGTHCTVTIDTTIPPPPLS